MTTSTNLVQVVHEHLSHLVNRHSGIDRALELQSAHDVRQEAQVRHVGERQEHCIDLVEVPTHL